MNMNFQSAIFSTAFLVVVGTSCVSMAQQPAFLNETPKDRVVVVYINDLMPHIERTLKSEAIGELIQTLSETTPNGSQTTAEEMLSQVKQKASVFIPTEIAITISTDGLAQFARLIRMAVSMGLCNGAIAAENGDALQTMQADFLKEVRQLTLNDIDIWVNFRTPLPAGLAFGQLASIVSGLKASGMIEADWDGASGVHIKGVLEKAASPDEMPYYLREFGLVDNVTSKAAKDISASLCALSLECSVTTVGNALRISFGPNSDADDRRLVTEDLGELWEFGPELIAYMKYDAEAFCERCIETLELWNRWESTAVGQETSKLDDEDLLGSLRDVVRQIQQGSGIGEFAASWKNDRMSFTAIAEDVDPIPTLEESQILDFLPSQPGLFHTTTVESLADFLSNRLAEFEDRLARKSLQYDLAGKTQQSEMAERITRTYYGGLGKFRKLIKEEAFLHFQPPYLAIMNSHGKVDSVKVSFQVDGESNEISGKNVPFLHCAVVGRLQQKRDIDGFPEQLWREFLEGISAVDLPEKAVTKVVDLGLGVETHAFVGDWQELLPNGIRVSIEGGAQPHYFRPQGDWFAFSTSPKLSKQLLESHRSSSASSNRTNTASASAELDSRLVTLGGVSGDSLASLYTVLSDTFGIVLDESGGVEANGKWAEMGLNSFRAEPSVDRARIFIDAVAASMRNIVQLHWQTLQDGRRQTTTGFISF